jgi:glutamate-1-semialdehyde 2,1-aminomutase
MLTPFHNMALMAPTTTKDEVDQHLDIFEQCIEELLA